MAKQQSINFLKVDSRSPQEKRRLFLIKFVSIVSLIVYCAIVAAVFLFSFSQENKLIKINTDLNKQTQALSRLEKTESLYLVLKQRLSFLRPILAERDFLFKQTADYFDGLLVEGVLITDMVWHSPDIFELSGQAENGLILSNYLKRLEGEVEVDMLDSVNLLSATRKEEGSYIFAVELDLKSIKNKT